ncbi:MAG: pirin family protein [Bacteroidales bacterium]|nr:pirin family protein [Bacteroidales bacterium]
MALTIIPVSEQADGEFNNGEIKEKKPIGFPQDNGKLKPYSNIFYWSFAKAYKDSTISEHPHKGFEILTFIIQGEIEHYDNKNKVWKKLTAGDIQVIQAGNGITHAESLLQYSEIFQIWFDPNLSKSINKEPSYKDYSSDKFPINIENEKSIKVYKGENAPIKMISEGIEIKEISMSANEYIIKLDNKKIYSGFVLEGEIVIKEKMLEKYEFFIIRNQDKEKIISLKDSRIFVIESPLKPSYKTYAQIHNLENKW